MTELSEYSPFSREEQDIAINVFSLVYGIGLARAVLESPHVPNYAKTGDIEEIEQREKELTELAAQHPEIIERMGISIPIIESSAEVKTIRED